MSHMPVRPCAVPLARLTIPFASVSGRMASESDGAPSRTTASLVRLLQGHGKAVKVETVALDVITGRHVLEAASNGWIEAEPAGLIEEGNPLVDK